MMDRKLLADAGEARWAQRHQSSELRDLIATSDIAESQAGIYTLGYADGAEDAVRASAKMLQEAGMRIDALKRELAAMRAGA